MKKYNWKEIQEFYDAGNSSREVITHFGMGGWSTLLRACRRGDLKCRTQSEGAILSHKKNPEKYKCSNETKKKLSDIRKKFLAENPDKVPYLLNHYSKGDSYPETYFMEVFEKEKINLKHHFRIGLYQLDFYNEEKKIDIEIDGEQHYSDKRIFESDIRRTNYLTTLGWKVYRIRWAKYQKMCHTDKVKIVEEIKSLLTS